MNNKSKPLVKSETSPSLDVQAKAIFAHFISDLQTVEKKITTTFVSDASDLKEISQYLLDLGGKRIRPLLALISSRVFGMKEPSQGVIDIASGIELIHMATLLHDDIIDNSSVRRGQESALKKFGRDATMLTGDFLFVRAFGLCGLLDDYTIKATESACVELIEGENLEGIIDESSDHSVEKYLTVIEKKTAALFALATELSTHLAGASTQDIDLMKTFGFNAGMAFQIVDDILDVIADEDLLGKKSGSDLRQATPSIINLYWLRDSKEQALSFFKKIQSSEEKEQEPLVTEAIQTIKSTNIIQESTNLAISYVKAAEDALDSLSNDFGSTKEAEMLRTILSYTLNRCS